jgi:hypothetical protein
MIETGKSSLTERNKKILIQELNINPKWLDEGLGNMFLADSRRPLPNQNFAQGVPLYNLKDVPSLVALFRKKEEYKAVGHINIPGLPSCDGALSIVGDSMYPILHSGDIVLYKQLSKVDEIFWGNMYLISMEMGGEEYITVRYIRKSEKAGMVLLVGENPLYAEKEVELSKIKAIAFVKASIRMNASK